MLRRYIDRLGLATAGYINRPMVSVGGEVLMGPQRCRRCRPPVRRVTGFSAVDVRQCRAFLWSRSCVPERKAVGLNANGEDRAGVPRPIPECTPGTPDGSE